MTTTERELQPDLTPQAGLRLRGRSLYAFVGVVALAAPLLACGPSGTTDEPPPSLSVTETGTIVLQADSPMLQRLTVDTVSARSMPTSSVSAPARLVMDPVQSANIRLPVPGRISKIEVNIGELVEENQRLMTVDSAEAGEAIAAYRQAAAAARRAQQDLDRAGDLQRIDAIPRRELLEAETELEFAQAELAHAARQLNVLGLTPDAADQPLALLSPLAGRVLDIAVSRGEFVADDDEPVAVVSDLSRLLAVATVSENRLRNLSSETEVELTLSAFPGETFTGQVRRVSDTLDAESRGVNVFVEIDNPDGRLRPAMFGTLVLSSPAVETPVVPIGTVVYQGGRAMVLVETATGRFDPREVRVGARRDDLLPVLEGLSAGDRVVTSGTILLIGQRPAT